MASKSPFFFWCSRHRFICRLYPITGSNGYCRRSGHRNTRQPTGIGRYRLVDQPHYYAAIILRRHWVGTLLMDIPPDTHAFEFSIDTLLSGLQHTWKPFLLGCFVLGSTASALGYGLARILWRWVIIKKWSLRKRKK